MRGARAWLWLTLILTLGGCGQNPGLPSTPAVGTPPQPAVAPLLSPVPGSNLSPDQQQAVAAALQDAATHLGVAASELSLQQIEAREWGDSSLGCPQPGSRPPQSVTPVFLTVINSRGKRLEYPSGVRGRVLLCQES